MYRESSEILSEVLAASGLLFRGTFVTTLDFDARASFMSLAL
jgi:hypothetical protein